MATRKTDDPKDTEPSVEDLAKQIETLRGDVEKLVETLGELGKAQGAEFADDLRARTEEIRRKSAARAAEAEARLSELSEEAALLARDRPAAAMGLAAGIGFLLGLMLTRR